MKTAKLFKNGQSQAVRLPKEFRMAGTEVYIKKQGEAVVLLPKETSWKPLFDSLNHFEKDFKIERNQPGEDQKRERLFQ
jgi:antitoxin VapB